MIVWSRNGGEEEEEGIAMLYSRLGMPVLINKTSFILELYVCLIDWSRNGGEEEEEGRGMLYSRLGMPVRMSFFGGSIDW